MERRQDPTEAPRSVRILVVGVLVVLALLAAPRTAAAQRLDLTLSGTSISFPDANPDLTPTIASVPASIQVTIRVRNNNNRPWRLTVVATDHLRSGPNVINANNISWTSSRTNQGWLAGGTLAVATPQTMAQGTGNRNPASSSNISFRLQNRWTYNPGAYTTTATFTLSAP